MADLIEVLVDTGCRLSEILFMPFTDIYFDANVLISWVNKGEKAKSIPMTSRVRTILLKRKASGDSKPFNITVAQVERAWCWVRNVMGLDEDKQWVIHALRHTLASSLVNADVDLYVVKEWLGHSTIQLTERYAHLNPKKLHNAVKLLETNDMQSQP
jgi:site-specific recombinase XerD